MHIYKYDFCHNAHQRAFSSFLSYFCLTQLGES